LLQISKERKMAEKHLNLTKSRLTYRRPLAKAQMVLREEVRGIPFSIDNNFWQYYIVEKL
jgi:hypothetical protein